jgi:ABC-type oligopeptide transport system substrate-binding subunit
MKTKTLFLIMLILLSACSSANPNPNGLINDSAEIESKASMVLNGEQEVTVMVGKNYVDLGALAFEGDLPLDVVVDGQVDTSVPGVYIILYEATDSSGRKLSETRTVTVVDPFIDFVKPTGTFDFKFASAELRHTFFAAAEKFMLDEMLGGIPLYAGSSFALFSDRLLTPLRSFAPIIGFGTSFSTMSQDDSSIEFEPGVTGVPGDYTYRTVLPSNPDTFNHWTYQGSNSSDVLSWALGALYFFDVNETRDGYEVKPDMASGLPQPVGEILLPTGIVVSRTWTIPLRNDLRFFFHPYNTLTIPAGSEQITAQTFLDTFELALTNRWERVGLLLGDSPGGIVNAEKFLNRERGITFDDVGIKVVNGNDIEFTFIDLQSEWTVKHWLSSFALTPIHIPLYEALGGGYGNSPMTIAYTGPYYISDYVADEVIRLRENPMHHAPDRYFFTGLNYAIIPDSTERIREFIAGRLDAVALPAAWYEGFRNDPRLRRVPGATVFRLNYNALGSVSNADKVSPKPLIASKDFRTAMYFAVDRERLAKEILKTVEPMQVFFTSAYLVDPELGINFRATEQGLGVAAEYSPATYGYDLNLARQLFDQALKPLIEAGTYRPGDVITFEYVINGGSDFDRLTFEFLKDAFESTFYSAEYNISVNFELIAAPFPLNYTRYLRGGLFDLGTGAISIGTSDASSFLAIYRYDTTEGFRFNWGSDQRLRQAIIPVVYQLDGQTQEELWSFGAIQRVLGGEVTLIEGREFGS